MKDRNAVSSAYDRWSSHYDTDDNRTRDLDAAVLRTHGSLVDGRDVLEIGCGTGKNTIWLAARARSVVGLDASPGMLSVARQRVSADSVRFVEHDVQTVWPLEGGSVDAVVVDLVLEHIDDLRPIFAEGARVLRRGGALFVCELHPMRQLLGARAHFVDKDRGEVVNVPVFRHSVAEFINGGIEAGLSVERVGEWFDDLATAGDGSDDSPRLFSVLLRKP